MKHLLSSPKFCDAALKASRKLSLAQYIVIDGCGDIQGDFEDWREANDLATECGGGVVFSVEAEPDLLPVILIPIE